MISPTVGRIVLFRPAGSVPTDQPHASIVAFVHDDRLINISAFNENGSPYARQSVVLVQDGDAIPTGAYAEWMPYQKGQAAKTEAATAAAATAAPTVSLEPVHARISDLEKGVDGKFTELGSYLQKAFADIETKVAAATTPPAPAPGAASTAAAAPAAATSAAAPATNAAPAAPAAAAAATEAQPGTAAPAAAT